MTRWRCDRYLAGSPVPTTTLFWSFAAAWESILSIGLSEQGWMAAYAASNVVFTRMRMRVEEEA